jgi:AcrR family transcriptional regulator
MTELGLRERKKQQTRELIAETARGLFAERGFEAVTVADVARAAEVSTQTVFNYFPTKEDLVYWRLGSFEAQLLSTIRERPRGEPAVAAFKRFLLSQDGLLGKHDPAARKELTAFTKMIDSSPALRAREAQVLAGYTQALASLLAEETGTKPGDVEPVVAANAMVGVHRALIAYTRKRILDGDLGPKLQREVRAQGERAFRLLEQGLGDYAASSTTRSSATA